MAILELSDVSKHYGEGSNRHQVLDRVNLKIEAGEFVAILGYSGSGKSTLVSALAGLIIADSGGVIYDGEEVTSPHPDRAVVFQSYSLMPWLSVEANIRLAVDSVHKTLNRRERAGMVQRYVDLVGLGHARARKPAELSGGMRQRVALARALAMQPRVLLLDEPLSALDALTRANLQDELAAISRQADSTIVLITNDVDEAILLADRVIPLTRAPGATLEREFVIDLPKPRDRTTLNSNPRFAELRAEITRYLVSLDEVNDTTQTIQRVLPELVPVRFGSQQHAANHGNAAAQINGAKTTLSDAHNAHLSVAEASAAGQHPARAAVPGTEPGEPLPQAYRDAADSHQQKRYLSFSQTSKVYPTPAGPLTVVEDFDLNIDRGEFVSLIGHSGCGKSTVLSMAAGLNPISTGGIVLDGLHVTDAGPDRAVVFQAPSLMPWLSAFENVMLGVERVYPRNSRAERREVAEYYLEKVGLGDAMHRRAEAFSGGMKQRVGIARAFALSPKLLLLDEPFGMLDSLTRWALQDVLMEVWSSTKVTAICVTHDVDEAILLADRVVMMSNGPRARVGNIMSVDLPRPRTREALLAHPHYYAYREELLAFLEAYEGGATPSEEHLQAIETQRALRIRVSSARGESLQTQSPVPPLEANTRHASTVVPGVVATEPMSTSLDTETAA